LQVQKNFLSLYLNLFFLLFLQLGTVEEEESSDDCYSTSVSLNKPQCQVLMRLNFRKKGCFRACISYRDQPLSNGEFDIIVLSGELILVLERVVEEIY